MSLLEIKNIKRDFRLGSEILHVLKGINLSIEKGEYLALMGPSGSGKSTLMNILGCLDTPTSGEYILNGKDVSKMSDSELADIRNKEIGFVFQTFNLMPRTTALDNVALPMVYAGVKKEKRHERAKEVLKLVGLEDRMLHKPNELSGGQRQALTLVMSTLVKPKLLLLDEHTAALDPKTSAMVMKLTDKIVKKNNLTTVMITHNMEHAIEYGDRLVMLHEGHVVVDIKGEEKKDLTVAKLLELFKKNSGSNIINDDMML